MAVFLRYFTMLTVARNMAGESYKMLGEIFKLTLRNITANLTFNNPLFDVYICNYYEHF
jgi:hypothetical protein